MLCDLHPWEAAPSTSSPQRALLMLSFLLLPLPALSPEEGPFLSQESPPTFPPKSPKSKGNSENNGFL